MDDVGFSVYNANASISVFVFESASNSLLLTPTCRELPYYRQVDGSVHQHVFLCVFM